MGVLETIREIGGKISLTDLAVCLPGVILLAIWLSRTSMGRKALVVSPTRRNSLPFYMPIVPLAVWMVLGALAIAIKEVLVTDLAKWQDVYLDNLVLCIGTVAAIIVIIFLARAHFARRLKGFGLNPGTIHKDLLAAAANLTAVYPIITFALVLTILVGRLLHGPGFELQKHEQLDMITEHAQVAVRALILITTVVVMPVFEEMLFRGLFQTMFRSYLSSSEFRFPRFCRRHCAWLAVALSSALFASVHANADHWPALFALSMCMGYAYEKSGSLFRPIFIHALFNAVSVIFTLQNT
ncbi:MAG: lysostaphin resistance A-like protein [Planctomycetota bacterium]|jgi:membrane protease YdiL (CAAX protease family)